MGTQLTNYRRPTIIKKQYFLVAMAFHGSQRAVGAYSSEELANHFKDAHPGLDLSVSPTSLEIDEDLPPEKLFATHQPISGGAFRIREVFTAKYKAQLSLEPGGIVRDLVLDDNEPEALKLAQAEAEEAAPVTTKITAPIIDSRKRDEHLAKSKQRRTLVLLAVSIGLGGFSLYYNLSYFAAPPVLQTETEVTFPERIVEVERLGQLPETATRISYFTDGRHRVYELDMDDRELPTWAASQGLALSELNGDPWDVPRYTTYTTASIQLEGQPGLPEAPLASSQPSIATITKGYALQPRPGRARDCSSRGPSTPTTTASTSTRSSIDDIRTKTSIPGKRRVHSG